MRRSFAILCLPLLFAACGGGDNTTEDKAPELVIGEDATSTGDSLYQMPTPNELFSLVRDMAGEGHRRMLNPEANAKRYASLRARAVNFGVYSTDLVYASYFELNVEVAKYYLVTKKLAESLGIEQAFTDADFVQLEKNLTRGDSLEVISNRAYQRAYEKLQNEEMGKVLALVLAGGWVESMHLVARQIEAFGPSEALMQRVAEQKVTLEHLIDLSQRYENDPDMGPVRRELMGIRDIYDRIDVRRVPGQERSASGRMVLGEEIHMDLTPDKYGELVRAVDLLRAAMIRPEDDPNA